MSLTSSQTNVMSIGALTYQDNKSEEPEIVYQTEKGSTSLFFRQNAFEKNSSTIWDYAQDKPIVYKNITDIDHSPKIPHLTPCSIMHELPSPSFSSSFFSSASSEYDYDSHGSLSPLPHSRRASTFTNNNTQQQRQQQQQQQQQQYKPWFNSSSKPIKIRITKNSTKEKREYEKSVGYMNDGYRLSLKTSQLTYPNHYTYFHHENTQHVHDKNNKMQHEMTNSSSSSSRNTDVTQTRRARNKLASAKYRAKKQALTHAMQERIMQLATQVISLRDELSHNKKNEAEIVARYNHLLNQFHQKSKNK